MAAIHSSDDKQLLVDILEWVYKNMENYNFSWTMALQIARQLRYDKNIPTLRYHLGSGFNNYYPFGFWAYSGLGFMLEFN